MSPGTIYPNRKWCGQGPEAIAQSRAIAYLGTKYQSQRVQWEDQVYGTSTRASRVDITLEQQTKLEVYEVKLTSRWTDPVAQADRYVDMLNDAGVVPVASLGQAATGSLSDFVDTFLVPAAGGKRCELPDGTTVPVYQAYFSAGGLINGVVVVYVSPDLPCFDPNTDAPPLPATISAPGGLETLDVGSAEDEFPGLTWTPYPGTELPSPTIPGGGGGGGGGGLGGGVGSPVGTGGTGGAGGGSVGGGPGQGGVGGPGAGGSGGSGGAGSGGSGGQAGSGSGLGPGGGQGTAIGDPHLATFDGLSYDLQAVGEFELVQSEQLGVDVQMRTVPRSDAASTIGALAMNVNDYGVEIAADGGLLIDGEEATVASGQSLDLGDGASIAADSGLYTVTWPGQESTRPKLRMWGTNVKMDVPYAPDVRGLLGNADGDRSNDLALADGEVLSASSSAAVIHGSFANSWRVTDESSLFTYGVGESTATYTDSDFPSQILTINDLTDQQLSAGTAQCSGAEVVDGRQFDDCVLDWALTEDYTFVQAAAQMTNPVVEAGARHIDAAGDIAEDFEDQVGANFDAPRYGTGTGSGTFAGPFSARMRYSFYVPDLPAHSAAHLNLNLVAFGDWNPLDGTAMHITVDGSVVWQENPGTLTPSSTGVTPSGKSYAIYPVSLAVPHDAEQLRVGIDSDVPLGSERAFGVDDIDAHLTLDPPQQFTASLPIDVTDGSPWSGAGNIEVRGGEDSYAFSTSQTGNLQIDISGCTTGQGWVRYKLIDVGSDATVVDDWSCSSQLVHGVPAGDYRLSISDRFGGGTYHLGVSLQPAPQTFAVSLPVTISDGGAQVGGGKLETTSSEDDYTFSTSEKGPIGIEVNDCGSGLGSLLHYAVTDTTTHVQFDAGTLVCGTAGVQLHDVVAGDYQVAISAGGRSGVYEIRIVAPPADVFDTSLPINVTAADTPWTGAGKLEYPASEDAYDFTTDAFGAVQIDISACSIGGGWVRYKLIDVESGTTVADDWSCGSQTVHGVPAGDYRLSISDRFGGGTYHLGVSLQPAPQSFAVSLPATITDGGAQVGAGKLETSSSEDDYTFSTSEKGPIGIEVNDCGSGLGSLLHYAVTNTTTHAQLDAGTAICGTAGVQLHDVAAGDYQVAITNAGHSGVYKIRIVAPPADVFDTTLPIDVTAADTPWTGAGKLEYPASEDAYDFTTDAFGAVQIDISACSIGGGWVRYKLTNVGSGTTVVDDWSCSSQTIHNVPAGDYRLSISDRFGGGTYHLGVSLQPAPQSFAVSLPVTISDGGAQVGGGKLETSSSEDDYTFSTSQKGPIGIEVNDCGSGLGSLLHYAVTNTTTHAQLDAGTAICGTAGVQLHDVAAGDYQVAITNAGHSGVYKIRIVAPPADVFDTTLPIDVTAADTPWTGAGKLEYPVSEDAYDFSLTQTGNVQIDISACSIGGGWVRYTLTNVGSGTTVVDDWSCSSQLVHSVPAGDYRLSISDRFGGGTYHLGISLQPAPQSFAVSLPVTVSDGGAQVGGGKLETTSSEDDYTFSTSQKGPIGIEVNDCGSGLSGLLHYVVTNSTTHVQLDAGTAICGAAGVQLHDVVAGSYQVAITASGHSGVYEIGIVAPPADVFDTSLPIDVTAADTPWAGAGKLEYPVSEDAYDFSLTQTGNLQIDISSCSIGGGWVRYTLTEVGSGATVVDDWSCSSQTVHNVAAGDYRLSISDRFGGGTYHLGVELS